MVDIVTNLTTSKAQEDQFLALEEWSETGAIFNKGCLKPQVQLVQACVYKLPLIRDNLRDLFL